MVEPRTGSENVRRICPVSRFKMKELRIGSVVSGVSKFTATALAADTALIALPLVSLMAPAKNDKYETLYVGVNAEFALMELRSANESVKVMTVERVPDRAPPVNANAVDEEGAARRVKLVGASVAGSTGSLKVSTRVP